MSLTSAKQVETNKYELEIAVDGDTFNAAVDQAFRKNGKKMYHAQQRGGAGIHRRPDADRVQNEFVLMKNYQRL